MEDTDSKVTGNTITAAIWNQAPKESVNVIEDAGITPSSGDLNQLGKGITGYVGSSGFYDAAGSVNAFELSVSGTFQAPPAYAEGMLVRFRPNLANTGAATVDVVGLGPKSLTREDGTALASGVLTTDIDVLARYDLGADEFHVLHASIVEGAGGGGTVGALGEIQFTDGAAGHDSATTLSYAEAGQALTVGGIVIDGDAASVGTVNTDLAVQTTGTGELSLISGAGSEPLTISSATLSFTPATQILDVGDVAIDGNAASIAAGGGRPLTISTGSLGGALTLSSGVGGGAGDLALNAGSGGQGGGSANSIDVTSVDFQYASASETVTVGADPTKQLVLTAGASPTVSVQGTAGHISLNATATDLQLAADSNIELSVGAADSAAWQTTDGTMDVGSTGLGAATFGTTGNADTAIAATGGGDVLVSSTAPGTVDIEGLTYPKAAAFGAPQDGFGMAYQDSSTSFIPVALSGSTTGAAGAVQFTDGVGNHTASTEFSYDDTPKELTIDDLVINGDTASLTTADTNLSIATSGTGDLAITSGTAGTGDLSLVAGAGGINDITINSANLKWTPAIQLMNLGNITLDGDAETIATEDVDLSVQTTGAGNLNLLSGTAGAGDILIQAGAAGANDIAVDANDIALDAGNELDIQGITFPKNADFAAKDGFGIAYSLAGTSFVPVALAIADNPTGVAGAVQTSDGAAAHAAFSEFVYTDATKTLAIADLSIEGDTDAVISTASEMSIESDKFTLGKPVTLGTELQIIEGAVETRIGLDGTVKAHMKVSGAIGTGIDLVSESGEPERFHVLGTTGMTLVVPGGSSDINWINDGAGLADMNVGTSGTGDTTIDSSGGGDTVISASGAGAVIVDGTEVLKGSASLAWTSITAFATQDKTITVTGAALADPVALGTPDASASTNINLTFTAWVSAADTITVRCYNGAGGAITPATATFNVRVYT